MAPATVTVNPLDPTVTRLAGWTSTTAPPDATSTVTSSCVTYDFRFPPHSPVSSVLQTQTVTVRRAVTVTDTKRPPVTQYEFFTPVVTVTTPLRTVVSYHCLNTLVVVYHDHPDLTITGTYWEHTRTTTAVCLTTSTRSTSLIGVTALPATPPLQDWEYFASTSLATKHTVAVLGLTAVRRSGTGTSTVCDNPTRTVTTTFQLRNKSTATVTATDSSACRPDSTSRPRAIEAGEEEEAEVHSVAYTTVTVIDNTVRTLTGTAVVDVRVQTFERTWVDYMTATGAATTTTAWVCTRPPS